MSIRGLVLAGVLCTGCYEPPTVCGIACDTECPGDLTCSPDHVCLPSDGTTCMTTELELREVTVGGKHVCGLDAGGSIYCWGDNESGQLGVASTERILTRPTKLDGTWTAVAAGGDHTCAIADGVVSCWGENNRGQVRAMSGGTSNRPALVEFGLAVHPRFETIAAGAAHSCALGDKQLWCWGEANFIGTNGPVSVATKLGPVDDWTAVTLGTDFGCGVSESMGVMCWGTNDDQQAGVPVSTPILTPRKLPGLPAGSVLAIDAGTSNGCAVIATSGGTTGELWCWGDGKIMGGNQNDPTAATQLGTDTGWTGVSVGDFSVCGALRGHVYCWGQTGSGIFGSGIWSEDRAQAEAADLGMLDDVSLNFRAMTGAGDRFACSRVGTQIRCWGDNSYGQLGLGLPSWFPTPVEVRAPSGRKWAHVVSGEQHTCGTLDDGSVQCWGKNDVGEVDPMHALGRAQPCVADAPCDVLRPLAAPVANPDDVVMAQHSTCARTGATVQCWGDPGNGALGQNTSGFGPTSFTAPTGTFVKLTGGMTATCGLLDTGKPACWGDVAGTNLLVPTPQMAAALQDMTQIMFGDRFACGVRSDNVRVCWGTQDDAGQLGNGTTTPSATPTAFPAPAIVAVSARGNHACAVTQAQNIACWGGNDNDQSGSDTLNTVLTPTNVQDASVPLAACRSVAVAYRHSCAVCDDKPYCWGENYFAQLGRGTTMPNSTSRAGLVAAPPELTYTEITALEGGGCTLSQDGRLFCWGDSWRGEVGVGAGGRSLPTLVLGGP